jgi:hypothetical protein
MIMHSHICVSEGSFESGEVYAHHRPSQFMLQSIVVVIFLVKRWTWNQIYS